jgi:hypothetical protein
MTVSVNALSASSAGALRQGAVELSAALHAAGPAAGCALWRCLFTPTAI